MNSYSFYPFSINADIGNSVNFVLIRISFSMAWLVVLRLKEIPIVYRDVITCYSKAHSFEYEIFKSTILNQTLWGNRFITVRKKGKKHLLLLRNWIGVEFDLLKRSI